MILSSRARAALGFARREIGAVLAVLTLALAADLFLSVAGEVAEGETGAIDRRVLFALRVPGRPGQPIGPPWLETAARDITSLGSIVVLSLIVLIIVGLFASLRRRREALTLLLTSGGGLLLTNLLKGLFGRARPDPIYRAVEATTSSFPSGHAVLSAVVFLTLAAICMGYVRSHLVRVYIMSVAVALTLVVGITRVYLGVHWLTDVLAGWGIGAAWATASWLVVWLCERRWRQPPPATGEGTAPAGAA